MNGNGSARALIPQPIADELEARCRAYIKQGNIEDAAKIMSIWFHRRRAGDKLLPPPPVTMAQLDAYSTMYSHQMTGWCDEIVSILVSAKGRSYHG
jgi:hypothetical protein